jgi:hypothetical protein
MYVYKSENGEDGKVYAVGYWAPVSLDGAPGPSFRVASRHNTPQEARRRVNYLNGGSVPASRGDPTA